MTRFARLTASLSALTFMGVWGLMGVAPKHVTAGMDAASREASTYYPNCKAAWAAGAAPIYRGQPGYRDAMDGDDDGIACEPYRR
jgi:hypothetical protein